MYQHDEQYSTVLIVKFMEEECTFSLSGMMLFYLVIRGWNFTWHVQDNTVDFVEPAEPDDTRDSVQILPKLT